LPIGLGVFAGISVIALIVVGLVTYERTKYRKAFRQRKLAEQGAGMGYNGMVSFSHLVRWEDANNSVGFQSQRV
jgi:hypothetical protein